MGDYYCGECAKAVNPEEEDDGFPCMCRTNHEPIGFARDDESCPLCDANSQLASLRERVARLTSYGNCPWCHADVPNLPNGEADTSHTFTCPAHPMRQIVAACEDLLRLVDSDNTEPVELARCRFDELREALRNATKGTP
jgi:hypothetical protein